MKQFLENSDYLGRFLPPSQSLAQSPRRDRIESDFDSFSEDRDSVFVDEGDGAGYVHSVLTTSNEAQALLVRYQGDLYRPFASRSGQA